MLETKMVSFMKFSKDTMSNPPSDATIDKLIANAKFMGATHAEIATVFGRPNWASESKRWADRIHNAGLNVTWRCASDVMEGLYGVVKAVGTNRKPPQFYIDLAVNNIKNNPTLFKPGDEWAIYPERTEGIWQDSTSWIWPNNPTNYGNFFNNLYDASTTAFAAIAMPGIKVGLWANNGSEVIGGWMQDSGIILKCGYAVTDHYVDGNPTKLEADCRAVKTKYGKPVYLQESAPDRFTTPTTTQIKAYFDALKRLVADGVLTRYGYWGGWPGPTEGLFNSDLTLNEKGLALKDFFGATAPAPTPTPTPIDVAKVKTLLGLVEGNLNTIDAAVNAARLTVAKIKTEFY